MTCLKLRIELVDEGRRGKKKTGIYRTLLVQDILTLRELHAVVMDSMGWDKCHLHKFENIPKPILDDLELKGVYDSDEFSLDHKEYGDPFNAVDGGPLLVHLNQHEGFIGLSMVLTRVGDFLLHHYDFGDGWQHLITVEEIMANTPDQLKWKPKIGEGFAYELVTAKRCCPPENCGGYRNFVELCEAVKKGDLDDWRVQTIDDWELEEWNPSKANEVPGLYKISDEAESRLSFIGQGGKLQSFKRAVI